MNKALLFVLALSVGWTDPVRADAGKHRYLNMAPVIQYGVASRTAEIALARTGAPASVSGNAEILVLGAHAFETAVKGSNGFVCYVGRSWEKDFDDPEFWNPNVRTPQCWNAAAVTSVLPLYLKRTEWVLAGLSTEQMIARTKAAWGNHEIGEPASQSVAFMMSKDQYISDPAPGAEAHWFPHIMIYVPTTESSKWGANVAGTPIFSATSDAVPITTFYVITPKWSDGTLGPYVQSNSENHHH